MRSSIRVRYMWELPPMNSSRSSIVGDSKSSSAIEFSIHSIQQASSLSMPRNLGVSATKSHTSSQSNNNLPHQTWHMTSHFFTVQQLSTSSDMAHDLTLLYSPTAIYLIRHGTWPHTSLQSNSYLPHQSSHTTPWNPTPDYLTRHCMWPHTPM